MDLARLLPKLSKRAAALLNRAVDEAARVMADRASDALAETIEVAHARREGPALVASVAIGTRDRPAGGEEFGDLDTPPAPAYRPGVRAAARVLSNP